jgi:hypothetical protein
MANLFSRTALQAATLPGFANLGAVQRTLQTAQLPTDLANWLNRLMLLQGVPIHYLVPDEGMLPPESIRFFYVDMNWVSALIDGAFSIGRNLTPAGDSVSQHVDRAVEPIVRPQLNRDAGAIRAKAFGLDAPPVTMQVVSGFLLRSKLVQNYPGIGVNAYPQGHTPSDKGQETIILNLLRLEQLGPTSDTLICLVDGDVWQVDVHQPPEQLHYGIDSYAYDDASKTVTAEKMIHTFTRQGSAITLSQATVPDRLQGCFRSDSPRTMIMTQLAAAIAADNQQASIDSAEMGFEMTEGVGQVSFTRSNS